MCTGTAEDAAFFTAAGLRVDAGVDKSDLRLLARTRRRSLPKLQRREAEFAIAGHLQAQASARDWRRVAAYAAVASEVDLAPWFDRVRGDLALALPAIDGDGRMQLCAWHPGQPLLPGPFAIPQPAAGAPVLEPAGFDVILLPLLGFDAAGIRLGSGAGYYDRAFAFRHRRPPPPLLVGIAFEVQRFDALPRDAWDVGLDAVVTEAGWFGRELAAPGAPAARAPALAAP